MTRPWAWIVCGVVTAAFEAFGENCLPAWKMCTKVHILERIRESERERERARGFCLLLLLCWPPLVLRPPACVLPRHQNGELPTQRIMTIWPGGQAPLQADAAQRLSRCCCYFQKIKEKIKENKKRKEKEILWWFTPRGKCEHVLLKVRRCQ